MRRALRALLVLVLAGPAVAQELWYRQPAARWEEALPIGNGRLGAMVFGGTGEERLALNEDSIWAGKPIERDRKGAHEHLMKARELLFEGKVVEAQALMQREFMSERLVRSYQPLGDLTLRFDGLGEITDYRRSLDLDTAVATTTFRADGVLHTRRVFSSPVDQVIVVRLEVDRPGTLNAAVELSRERDGRVTILRPDLAHLSGHALHRVDGEPVHHGVLFGAILRIQVEGGDLRVQDDVQRVVGADSATILLSADSDYGTGSWVDEAAWRMREAEQRTFDELLTDHLAEHRRLYRRVALDLGGHAARELPTDERLAAVREGADDPDLVATYFQFGRYLLISCSRPGSMPANLQGLWNPHLEAPWNSDYHININCQMNYWPAEVTNLAECHEPFFDLIDGIQRRGRETARELYGAPGWVAHHTTDAWWFTSPIGRTVWGLWPTGGAWCTRHLWEHYEYGGDLEFLRDRAWYPMREAAEFFLAYLIPDSETGLWVSGPSSSPENRFRTEDGQEADTCMGATMDQAIVWDLFTNVLAAAGELGIEDELVASVRYARSRLSPPRVGEDGRLLEWSRPYEEVEPGHRHMSHLFGLHPGRQITRDGTPELFAAARRSLEHRLSHGGGHTGWSRAWIVNFYARFGDGERAHENLTALLRKSTLPNLFDDHPPFQIDGNFGGTAGLAEMLLQSHEGRLALLPALPAAWPSGSVRGLRARGGITVDLTWKDGALEAARLVSDRDRSVRVALGERAKTLELTAGSALRVGPADLD